MPARWKRPRKPRDVIEEMRWWAEDLRLADPKHPDAATLDACLGIVRGLGASCYQQRQWIDRLQATLSEAAEEARRALEHQARLRKAEAQQHERLRKAEAQQYEANVRALRARAEDAEHEARKRYQSRVAALERAHASLMIALDDVDGQTEGARKRMCGANLNSTEKQIVSALLSFASKECPTIAPEDTFEAAIGKVSVAMRALRDEVERLRSGRAPAPAAGTSPTPLRMNGHA